MKSTLLINAVVEFRKKLSVVSLNFLQLYKLKLVSNSKQIETFTF